MTNIHEMTASLEQFCETATGMRLCYSSHGDVHGQPMLLIAGLGLQLTSWSPLMLSGLVRRGFRVIVFDNRDVGRSSRVAAPPPGLWHQFFRLPAPGAYDLSDMAKDALALLDHLGIERTHLVGMSMGGMIAQTMAFLSPQRVISLTSIFSTTGARDIGQPALSTLLRLIKRQAKSRDEAVLRNLSLMRHIGSTRYAMAEQKMRVHAELAWARGNGISAHEGVARQIGAIFKSGDRSAQVRAITAPTLVLHGDQDLMVAHSGGQATAAAIAGADFITIGGMGHYLPDGVMPVLLDLIGGHARRSIASTPTVQEQEQTA